MEITYRMREEDFQAACENQVRRSPASRYQIPRMVAGMGGLWLAFSALLWSTSHDVFTVGGFLCFGLVLVAVLPGTMRKARRDGHATFCRDERNRVVREPITLRVEEDGLACERASGWSKIRWTYVDSIFQTERHLFIYLGSLSTFTVPKDAVISGNLEAFAQQVERRCRGASESLPLAP